MGRALRGRRADRVPQLPHSPLPSPEGPPGSFRRDARELAPLRLPRHAAPPTSGLPATRQERDVAIEALLRAAARQSRLAAPPDLGSAIRDSLSHVSIEPQRPVRPFPSHLAEVPQALAEAWVQARTLVYYPELSERQRRVALGGASTLGLAVLCLVGLALNPGDIVAALGVLSAVALLLLAVGHLLSATVAALLGSGLLAVAVIALYATLAALWVHLVQQPLEA